ncbi:putative conjugative transfer protein TraA [Orientia tsutsugamushi str. Gilliam]|uniref:Putative conjugative transfer protein TraA n=1 Tax=Orientia tsutsugamushi str. Gilliam TaxID=1359184 RepID=A0A0F3M6Y8_ORITS|nr:putative conjugative transfer protein TraA [Orientia tsutsugamushi str. Gilliam]
MSKLIYNWSLSKFKPHEKLVITVRNKDVDILNSSIRSLLKANGTLQGTEYRRSIAGRKSPIWQEIESYFKQTIRIYKYKIVNLQL